MKKILLVLLFCLIPNSVFAQETPITVSDLMKETVFDGKWSSKQEWKPTTATQFRFNDGQEMVLRAAHDYENFYFLVDFVTHTKIQNNNDRAFICLNNNLEDTINPTTSTFCFFVTMGTNNVNTLQGGSPLASTGFYKNIKNHPELIAIGNISDEHDRYSKIPHASYEFKIPIDVIGRSNMYGFYVNVLDGKTGQEYTWPKDITEKKYPFIPTTEKWGVLISPDKSIPEFSFPIIIFIVSLSLYIILKQYHVLNRFIRL